LWFFRLVLDIAGCIYALRLPYTRLPFVTFYVGLRTFALHTRVFLPFLFSGLPFGLLRSRFRARVSTPSLRYWFYLHVAVHLDCHYRFLIPGCVGYRLVCGSAGYTVPFSTTHTVADSVLTDRFATLPHTWLGLPRWDHLCPRFTLHTRYLPLHLHAFVATFARFYAAARFAVAGCRAYAWKAAFCGWFVYFYTWFVTRHGYRLRTHHHTHHYTLPVTGSRLVVLLPSAFTVEGRPCHSVSYVTFTRGCYHTFPGSRSTGEALPFCTCLVLRITAIQFSHSPFCTQLRLAGARFARCVIAYRLVCTARFWIACRTRGSVVPFTGYICCCLRSGSPRLVGSVWLPASFLVAFYFHYVPRFWLARLLPFCSATHVLPVIHCVVHATEHGCVTLYALALCYTTPAVTAIFAFYKARAGYILHSSRVLLPRLPLVAATVTVGFTHLRFYTYHLPGSSGSL